ncbi:c-type cytochrome biogenesis protein CcmI [Geminicoccus flavidas]|uniref:c-type cytochrome biogenesis protein CcmI n=1 Tax=Geminicoccus flavidas TaxID=2506407 RepID=UPI00135CB15A|nr:c-type cytochrome biogenesis protein CcmI [Geminicoccus flavidas]
MIEGSFLLAAVPVLAVAVLCLLWPLLARRAVAPRGRHDLAVYRDQLAEVDRDQARGLILPDQAEAARIEIRRRILRVSAAEEAGTPDPAPGRRAPVAAVATLAALLPVLGFATYLALGRPDLPSRPADDAAGPLASGEQRALLEKAAAELSDRLGQAPDDPGGWLELGRLQAELGRMDEAIGSLRRARTQAPDDPRLPVELADLLTRAAGGVVSPEALELFREALEAPGGEAAADPRAAYFVGVAEAQAGDVPSAIERWRRLLARAPEDAPWRAQLVESIRVAASQAGLDAGDPGATAVQGMPDAQAMAEMAELTPEERDQRIRAMVDGLEARLQADPDNADGWVRLARAREVLDEKARAATAYERAAALRPDDPAILAAWGNALITEQHAPTGLPLVNDAAKDVFERLEKLAPDDPQPAWFLGLAAVQAGDRAGALAHWSALLDRLPTDHPDRAAIEQLIHELRP